MAKSGGLELGDTFLIVSPRWHSSTEKNAFRYPVLLHFPPFLNHLVYDTDLTKLLDASDLIWCGGRRFKVYIICTIKQQTT